MFIMERVGKSHQSPRVVAEAPRRAGRAGTWWRAVFGPARRPLAGRKDLPRSLRWAPDWNPAKCRLSRLAGHAAAQLGQLGAGGLDVLGRDGRARLGVGGVAPAHAGAVHPARLGIGRKDRH